MRISILDDYQQCMTSLEAFQRLNKHEVQVLHKIYEDEEQLVVDLNDPEALILNRTRTWITPSLLDALPNLKVISQTGKNAGHIDVDACQRKGVVILEGRGNPIATAELSWALIMNGLRLLPQAITGMKEGHWQTNIGRRISGMTIGLWGYGRIGQKVASYAKAFDARVLVWGSESSRKKAIEDGFEAASNKHMFFTESDVVSLHLRLKETTRGVVKLDDLKMMKEDALLVNTSRAALVEKDALLKSLQFGRPGYAALDVFEEEPIRNQSHPFLKMENVICTPHLGYVEKESYELYFGIAFQNLLDWIEKSIKQ